MDSPILDCESLSTAVSTTAAILSLNSNDLEKFVGQLRYGEQKSAPLEEWVLGAVTNSLGARQVTSWTHTNYFHGTRVMEPRSLLSGIEPLDARLDDVWDLLRKITEQRVGEWRSFRRSLEAGRVRCDSAYLYRAKVEAEAEQGPFGFLVRDALFVKDAGLHDYLGGPEIVEDILRCFDELHGTRTLARYLQSTSPCVVKFLQEDSSQEALGYALAHVWEALTEKPSYSLEWTTDAGRVIPPNQIQWIQVIAHDQVASVIHP